MRQDKRELGTRPAADTAGGRRDESAGQALVGQTARFTTTFVRWMEGHTCDGLSYPRLQLLQALHCGGPAIMRDIGAQLGASPRNMTALVDALEEAGLVVRRPHPTDRRATLVELSAAGMREAEQDLGARLDAIAEIFSALSAEERDQFSVVLSKLSRAMGSGAGQC
jgi:DNA-binding MarR family transcriptional regulator